MARRTKAQIQMENTVSRLCQEACNGWQINIMDLSKLSAAGTAAANAGGDEAAIRTAIHAVRDAVGKKV
jgi:hypothetical protein